MIMLITKNWYSRSRPKSRTKLTSCEHSSLPSRVAPLPSLSHVERLRSAMDAIVDPGTESTIHVSHWAVKYARSLEWCPQVNNARTSICAETASSMYEITRFSSRHFTDLMSMEPIKRGVHGTHDFVPIKAAPETPETGHPPRY